MTSRLNKRFIQSIIMSKKKIVIIVGVIITVLILLIGCLLVISKINTPQQPNISLPIISPASSPLSTPVSLVLTVKDTKQFLTTESKIDSNRALSNNPDLVFQIITYGLKQSSLTKTVSYTNEGGDGDECGFTTKGKYSLVKDLFETSTVKECFLGMIHQETKTFEQVKTTYSNDYPRDTDNVTTDQTYYTSLIVPFRNIYDDTESLLTDEGYNSSRFTRTISSKIIAATNQSNEAIEYIIHYEFNEIKANTGLVKSIAADTILFSFDIIYRIDLDGKINYVKLPNVLGSGEYTFEYNKPVEFKADF